MEKNYILLFGGDSDERLVSVASAQSMAQAIKPKKLWFWHVNGAVYEIDYQDLLDHNKPFTDEFKPKNSPLFDDIKEAVSSKESADYVFVLGLHGGLGENGYVQGLLEQYNRPFTGSSAEASACAFDKIKAKEMLSQYDIRMAPHAVLDGAEPNNSKTLKDFFTQHQEIIVKPACGGSSLGCFFIRNHNQIEEVAKIIATKKQKFLAEKIIKGREITVGVIEDNEGLRALVGSEIVLEKNRSFDYQGKYLGEGAKEVTPALLDDDLMREAQRIALLAHKGLLLSGYSRTDLILSEDGFYYLETNTLPGLSKASFIPQQLAYAGISLREFLMGQIEFAVTKNHE